MGAATRGVVGSIMGVRMEGDAGNYLGLPSLVGKNKRDILGFIKSKIVTIISSWNHNFLSRAGREVLIKSVIQAIPSFAMNLFLLHKGLIVVVSVDTTVITLTTILINDINLTTILINDVCTCLTDFV